MRIVDHPSPNRDARPGGQAIDTLVLHYTGMQTGRAALERLCDPAAEVSAHYLIEEDGTILRLVAEAERAWHAGRSFWRGATGLNARSIGIELVNPGHEFGLAPFPEAQLTALIALACEILARHPIPAVNVVGHSDIAPDRKTDPGELFPWQRLASTGVGLWPDPVPARASDLPDLLVRIGYDPAAEQAIAAFQRHFRPSRIDNRADDETAALAAGLLHAIP